MAGLALATAALGAGLSACKPGINPADAQTAPPPLAALPLIDAAGGPVGYAPRPDRLPPARPVPIRYGLGPPEQYAYLDRAWSLNDAFYDAPPDYEFWYDDVAPWVWETDDRYVRVAEPLPDGWRYYYYEPGVRYPFLIRDPDYAYGFAGGALTIIYDSGGRPAPYDALPSRADLAGRYLARAEALYAASRQDRRPVARQLWSERRAQISQDVARFAALPRRQDAWRSYQDTHAQQELAHWAPERYRRAAAAARFSREARDMSAADRDLRAAREAQERARRAGLQIATNPERRGLERTALNAADLDRRQQEMFARNDARQAQQERIVEQRQAQMQARQEQQAQLVEQRRAQQARAQELRQAQMQARQEQQARVADERQARNARAQETRQAQMQARQEQQARVANERQAQNARVQEARQAQMQARVANERQAQNARAQEARQAQVQARQAQQNRLANERQAQAQAGNAQAAEQHARAAVQQQADRRNQLAQAQAQKAQAARAAANERAKGKGKPREG